MSWTRSPASSFSARPQEQFLQAFREVLQSPEVCDRDRAQGCCAVRDTCRQCAEMLDDSTFLRVIERSQTDAVQADNLHGKE